MRAELTDLLDAGATLLTPNRRLALHLKRDYDAMQLASGRSVWPTADILPWNAWIERCYEDVLHSPRAGELPSLLGPAQEQALWEEVIRGSDIADALLAPAAAAANAAPRAAPPLPATKTVDFPRRTCFCKGVVMPSASVLVPRHFPARRHTVFTAPMRRASGST